MRLRRSHFPLLIASLALIAAACGDSAEETIPSVPLAQAATQNTTTTTAPQINVTVITSAGPTSTLLEGGGTTTTTTTTPTTTTSSTTTTMIVFKEISITAAEEAVVGGGLIPVPVGTPVRIFVVAAEEDTVVVGGYGVTAKVGPDRLAILEFLADETGTFPVTLQLSTRDLAELLVS